MRVRSMVVAALAAGVAVAGFGAGAVAGGPAADPPPGVGASALGDFDLTRPQVVASNLTVPWGMDFLPDGSALVALRNSGQVQRVRPGQPPQQVAQIAGVNAVGEGGLLGLAVSPTYAQDGYVYVYLTTSTDNRIVRFRLTAPQTQQPILTGLPRASIHNGGRIAFGPDGLLYAGVGDAGQTSTAQDPQSRAGKILRLRPDGTVPPDNPFPGSLVYSLGHRNVQGLAWDAQGRLYATEFGQNTWDEVNLIVAGGNYGWPVVEGRGTDPRYRNPLVVWSTAQASPSGAAIAGNRLYVAALRGTRLWNVPLDGAGGVGTPVAELTGTYGRLRTVEYGPDGWLWVATSNRDGRGTPAATDDRILRFPPRDTTPQPTGSPQTSPPAPPTTQPPTTAPTSCQVSWTTNQWTGGFTAEVRITNQGPALAGWALTWSFGADQRVTNAWNAQVTQSGAAVTARNVEWNGAVPQGGTASFGVQGSAGSANPTPDAFQLNGTPCQRLG
ncbi:oxidoreductase [Micromonospora rosaria]|uniref:Oxidoreductase n=1 Tax=Micromonospora rosaria TaxID=47874 RepID=A0A136PQ72_9ACTN|nr:PQQ-dependent sugar dehydrogenase [Micromonospora rosaria]KXK60620.1 oxidoreductase [Micromonospora rosaria]